MKRILKSLALIAAFSGVLPSAALAFRAINGLDVNKVDNNVFEVIGRGRLGKSDYWCSAADYLRRQQGLPWKTKIYVVSGIGRGVTTGARSAVRFTANPDAIGLPLYEGGWVGDILTVGYGMSMTSANNYCNDRVLRNFWD